MISMWTLHEAKNKFSEVVEHALKDGPQTITRRGKETAVLVSISAFRSLSTADGNLVEFLQTSPLAGADLDLARPREYGRRIDL